MQTYTIVYAFDEPLPKMEHVKAENIDNLRRNLCHIAPWNVIHVYRGVIGSDKNHLGVLTYTTDPYKRFWGKYERGVKKKAVDPKTGKLRRLS